MPLDEDPWIANHSPVSPAILHALGYLDWRWNVAEVGLQIAFSTITGQKFTKSWESNHDKRFRDLAKIIRRSIAVSKHESDTKAAALHLIELYDVNRLNRNQLTHFLVSASRQGIEIRNRKNPSVKEIYESPAIPLSLSDVRRICEDVDVLGEYTYNLVEHFISGSTDWLAMTPSPSKPPLPDRLWTPPQRSNTRKR